MYVSLSCRAALLSPCRSPLVVVPYLPAAPVAPAAVSRHPAPTLPCPCALCGGAPVAAGAVAVPDVVVFALPLPVIFGFLLLRSPGSTGDDGHVADDTNPEAESQEYIQVSCLVVASVGYHIFLVGCGIRGLPAGRAERQAGDE